MLYEIAKNLNVHNKILWIIFSLVTKAIFFLTLIHPQLNLLPHIGPFILSGDHGEYITPIDNFFERGIYALSNSNTPYAGRLPGFIFPYGIYRAFFNENTSNILLGVTLVLLSAISCYYLAKTIYNINQNKISFLTGFLLINFIPYYWHWDWTLHPNSLACSIIIMSIYFLVKYKQNGNLFYMLLTGIGISWVFMLRGFTFLNILIFGAYILMQHIILKDSAKKIILTLCVYLLPLITFEGLWITRNYYTLHKFIPLQTSFVPGQENDQSEYGKNSSTKYSIIKVRELINCWGGDNFWYFKNADLAWFMGRENSNIDEVFPEDIFFSGFTKDSIIELKKDIVHSYKPEVMGEELNETEKRIIERSKRFKKIFLNNNIAYYYTKAPRNRLKNFLFRNPTQDWPVGSFEKLNLFGKCLKLISVMEYFIVILLIIIFPVIGFIKKINPFTWFIWLIPISLILLFSFLINAAHYSYFQTGYVIGVLLIGILIGDVLKSRSPNNL